MVPTFIIDWPIVILIGLAFGYGVKGRPTRGFFWTRAFISGKFLITLFVIIVYYSYLLAPDWMWMYFVKDSTLPRWLVWYVLVLYYFAYAAGFALTVEGYKWRRWYPPFAIVLMFAWEFVLIWALQERYVVVGSVAEFLSGKAVPLAESTVGNLPTILSGLLIPLALGLIVWSRKQRFV